MRHDHLRERAANCEAYPGQATIAQPPHPPLGARERAHPATHKHMACALAAPPSRGDTHVTLTARCARSCCCSDRRVASRGPNTAASTRVWPISNITDPSARLRNPSLTRMARDSPGLRPSRRSPEYETNSVRCAPTPPRPLPLEDDAAACGAHSCRPSQLRRRRGQPLLTILCWKE